MATNEMMPPVKYTDGFYHIGARSAPSWLLESTDGLILLDTGMPATLPEILEKIELLGYSVRDVRHILHSHGHIDHIGSTRALVEMTGARTYIGRGDEDTVSGRDGLQYTNEFNMPFEGAFLPDVTVGDGDRLVIGNRTFEFIASPGHTRGTLSIFFNVTDRGREYRAGMFGGGGLNTMSSDYLKKYGLPPSLRHDFLASIDRVMDERVEVHVGNHLGDNGHLDKLARMGGEENPFLDGSTWKPFLEKRRAEAVAKFEEDPIAE